MPTAYLEWGQDLVVLPNGSIQLASGWDEVRQRIERRLLTSPLEVLPSGAKVPPDYIWDVNYGLGVGKLVDQNLDANFLGAIRQKCNEGVMVDADVSDANPPGVALYKINPYTTYLVIGVTLKNGTPGTITIQST